MNQPSKEKIPSIARFFAQGELRLIKQRLSTLLNLESEQTGENDDAIKIEQQRLSHRSRPDTGAGRAKNHQQKTQIEQQERDLLPE